MHWTIHYCQHWTALYEDTTQNRQALSLMNLFDEFDELLYGITCSELVWRTVCDLSIFKESDHLWTVATCLFKSLLR